MPPALTANDIRSRFLRYFERQGHAIRPSASLVPADDPTLLFVNAGMVPFKRVFLGLEQPEFGRRATTSQKCVRAGGKHNDLEQVGHTARHHTFFEMLGNFSFGDYFKRDAIRFAWEFVTSELQIPKEHLRVSVFRTDDEARALWREIAGLPDSRIYGLGEADNFWQMADTGPCGPCSEIYVDLAHLARDWRFPAGATGEWTELDRAEFSEEAFVYGAEAGRFLEIWNLVFMQFDRQADGEMRPLPKPSVDTGAGLERIAASLQGVTNNFHTDLFLPLLKSVEDAVGLRYTDFPLPGSSRRAMDGQADPAAFRVLADHARAVSFLMADGVFPSNEGRGYVLRRILRRAVRHAWLLGRREPTLVRVVQSVIDSMGEVYPELRLRAKHLVDTTRAEEERFLETIEGGMSRFDQLAPAGRTTQGSLAMQGTISGEDAFRLYDTFGFPIDLTELMARERGYTVDTAGFDRALDAQRTQSKEERRSRRLTVPGDAPGEQQPWEYPDEQARSAPAGQLRFVGYDTLEAQTQVAAKRDMGGGRAALVLTERPFYVESGGQISDRGEIIGQGWRLEVEEVRKSDGRVAMIGRIEGEFQWGPVTARVPRDTRHDTERNHTATHLLHAALRQVLGDHVHQRGSLVAPDRLRFDFSHPSPLGAASIAEVEGQVNREIARAVPVTWIEKPYAAAVASGAMALFGEKYGDVVRVVMVPGFSAELCGGTHVRNTSEILQFKIVSETGVGGGTRRIEAVTGRGAYERTRIYDGAIERIAAALRAPADPGALAGRVEHLVTERRTLEKRIADAAKAGALGGAGGDQAGDLVLRAQAVDGTRVVAERVQTADVKSLQALGDALRERLGSGIGVLGASFDDGKHTLLVVVTDDLRARDVRADAIIRDLAAAAGGKGGGKPHMAQAGLPDASGIGTALDAVLPTVRRVLTPGRPGS
jgi:alanyl-tRNA synthetase